MARTKQTLMLQRIVIGRSGGGAPRTYRLVRRRSATRRLLAAILAALLVAAIAAPAASAQTAAQCPNQGALGQLTVDNTRSGLDALVVLAGSSGAVAASQYIQRGSSYTICAIADGSYALYWTSGAGFDSTVGRFTSQVSYQRFSDELAFQTTRTQYTTYAVTLYAVSDGAASTRAVGPDQFPSTAPVTQSYQTPNGPRTAAQMGAELRTAGYGGPWDTTSVVAAYLRTTGAPRGQTSPQPTPTAPGPRAQPGTPAAPTGTVRVSNSTGGSLAVSVTGPISDSWSIPNGRTSDRSLPIGSYQLFVQADCGSETDTATVTTTAVDIHSYSCVSY